MSETRGEQAMSEAFERPFRPVELRDATLTSFPVQEMAQQLMTEEAFRTSGRNALTLVRDQNLTVVLTVLKAGAVLQEHHAPAPVTLLPLFGNFVLMADEGRKSTELSPGTTGAFSAHLEHRVEATQDSAFLIVMGGQS
jgi:quercetin dioxygenase-like cupin family protein